MERILGRIAPGIAVSALVTATLLSHVGQGQSRTGSGEPPARGEATQIRILPDVDFKKIEFLERYCFDEVNRERKANGLGDLQFFDDLVPVARRYSRRMAEEGFFSHSDANGLTIKFRLAEARIKSSERAENLSRIEGYINPVPEVVRGWMKSPGHCKNILDDKYTHSAIGVWITGDNQIFFTQIFIR
jgi:uncharacterized protein YkwD